MVEKLKDLLDPNAYYTSSRAYLERAKIALREETTKHLFYAAYELRCCVEARQLEYADALEELQGKKIKHWNISETHRRIRKHSGTGQIAHMRFSKGGASVDLYHVPVSERLKSLAERLGDLLHARPDMLIAGSSPHQKLAHRVIETYKECWFCCRGNTLVPPLIGPNGKDVHPLRIEFDNRTMEKIEALKFEKGAQFEVRVRYLDCPPNSWKVEF